MERAFPWMMLALLVWANHEMIAGEVGMGTIVLADSFMAFAWFGIK